MVQRDAKIVVGVAAVMVVAGILFIVFRPRAEGGPSTAGATPESVVAPVGSLTRSGELVEDGGLPAEPPPPPSPVIAAQQTATVFGERYGSFSSEGNFVNIEDLYPIMTDRFRRDRAAFVAAQRAAERTGEYRATRTTVVRADVVLTGDTAATATLATQRTEGGSDGAARTYPQELRVSLVREDGAWLVDDAVWGAS